MLHLFALSSKIEHLIASYFLCSYYVCIQCSYDNFIFALQDNPSIISLTEIYREVRFLVFIFCYFFKPLYSAMILLRGISLLSNLKIPFVFKKNLYQTFSVLKNFVRFFGLMNCPSDLTLVLKKAVSALIST